MGDFSINKPFFLFFAIIQFNDDSDGMILRVTEVTETPVSMISRSTKNENLGEKDYDSLRELVTTFKNWLCI